MISLPKIACICPTFKRPDCVRNAAACFVAQDYPAENCRLFVLDDAGQFEAGEVGNIHVRTMQEQIQPLAAKFHALVNWARGLWDFDVIALWEDDDVYLPRHLDALAILFANNPPGTVITPRTVYSNYMMPFGEVRREPASDPRNNLARFHGSWAFDLTAYEQSGGWPDTTEISFDIQFLHKLRANATQIVHEGQPTYVYRWGNPTYHGSAFKGDFTRTVGELALPCHPQGQLKPQMDEETKRILGRLYPTTQKVAP